MKAVTTDKDKEPKLTKKQRLWLKEYFSTGNATKAALKSYDTDDYTAASVIASENLAKLREPIKTYMEAQGLSLGELVRGVKEGLKAERIVTSHTEPDKAIPDHLARHKYIETAAKWLGMEKKEPTTLIQNNFGEHAKKELEEFE